MGACCRPFWRTGGVSDGNISVSVQVGDGGEDSGGIRRDWLTGPAGVDQSAVLSPVTTEPVHFECGDGPSAPLDEDTDSAPPSLGDDVDGAFGGASVGAFRRAVSSTFLFPPLLRREVVGESYRVVLIGPELAPSGVVHRMGSQDVLSVSLDEQTVSGTAG